MNTMAAALILCTIIICFTIYLIVDDIIGAYLKVRGFENDIEEEEEGEK